MLEYVCHVRDVFLVQRERLVLAQVEDVPSFVLMYRDQRVELCGYNVQSADVALTQVEMAADLWRFRVRTGRGADVGPAVRL